MVRHAGAEKGARQLSEEGVDTRTATGWWPCVRRRTSAPVRSPRLLLPRAHDVDASLIAHAEVNDAAAAEAGDRRAAGERDAIDQLALAIDHVVLGASRE